MGVYNEIAEALRASALGFESYDYQNRMYLVSEYWDYPNKTFPYGRIIIEEVGPQDYEVTAESDDLTKLIFSKNYSSFKRAVDIAVYLEGDHFKGMWQK